MKPPTGYYRKLMPEKLNDVRLALTNQPMTGIRILPISEELAKHFDSLSDEHAPYYAQGLRNGDFVPVVPNDRYFAPGELFFKS
jgi:hypothetical protein